MHSIQCFVFFVGSILPSYAYLVSPPIHFRMCFGFVSYYLAFCDTRSPLFSYLRPERRSRVVVEVLER